MTGPTTVEGITELVGRVVGPTDWVLVDQERVDLFAEATGDRQWIHTDPKRAITGPYSGTIAHGYLTLALLGPFHQELFPVVGLPIGVNGGLRAIRFPAPVPVPSRLRASAEVLAARPTHAGLYLTCRMTVHRADGLRPVCVAETITLHTTEE